MATSTLNNPRLHVVPLAEANLTRLEELFDEQCDEWLSRFGWDYSGPSRLIREVARRRELSGFAAMAGSRMLGFSFYVLEGSRCSIGDLYVNAGSRHLGADRRMLTAIFDETDLFPRIRRIESQCLQIGNEAANQLFRSRRFESLERHYMTTPVHGVREGSGPGGPRKEAQRIIFRPWRDEDFADSARIIHRSYMDQYDSRVNSQYRTEEGCADLLAILTDHIWCGDFLPAASRVAVDEQTGRRVGVLIASRISAGMGHISQISILPAYQNQGIGRHMIEQCARELDGRGFEKVSLAVTSANAAALHLYESCGFQTVHHFPVFYLEWE